MPPACATGSANSRGVDDRGAPEKELGVKCQCCPNEATVHLVETVEGTNREIHLCPGCAEKHHLLNPPELNLPAIIQALIGQHVGQLTDELARLTCPACGIKYMEFRAEGRLGCPNDYQVFRAGLEPILERFHRAGRHKGKSPRRFAAYAALQTELLELRRRLQTAVEAEAYEEAARLRDLLRIKETTDESG